MYGHGVFFDVKGSEYLSFPSLIHSGGIFSFAANTDAVLERGFQWNQWQCCQENPNTKQTKQMLFFL